MLGGGGTSRAPDTKHGKIIPNHREIARETSGPSPPACALLRAGPALSVCWGFAQGVGGGKGLANYHRNVWEGPPAHHPVLCSGGTHRSKTDS